MPKRLKQALLIAFVLCTTTWLLIFRTHLPDSAPDPGTITIEVSNRTHRSQVRQPSPAVPILPAPSSPHKPTNAVRIPTSEVPTQAVELQPATQPHSAAVEPILQLTSSTKSAAIQAIRDLATTTLTESDSDALLNFLSRPAGEFDMDSLQINAIKNNLLDVLLEMEPLREELGPRLVEMYQDPRMDSVWRNYIVQHLDRYYAARWPAGQAVEDDPEYEAFAEFMWGVTYDVNGDAAGTALLALDRLSLHYPEFEAAQLAERSVAVAANPQAAGSSRISALQVAAGLGATGVVSVSRSLVTESPSIPLQISAIAALGQVGDKSDAATLKTMLADSETDPRLLPALRAALAKLDGRTGKAVPAER